MSHRVERLTLSQLFIDPEVQRKASVARVAGMAADLNPAGLAAIVVSARDDGTYHVVDGQHRVLAARRAGYSEPIDAVVHRGLSRQDEARLFRVLQDQRRVGVRDLMHIRLIEGESVAVLIDQILTKYGWAIKGGGGDGFAGISATGALDLVANLDPSGDRHVFERTISVITQAWGHSSAGMGSPIIGGVGRVFDRHGMNVDDAGVVRVLSRHVPDQVIGASSAYRSIYKTRADAVAHWIVVEYNKKRTASRLPSWS